MYSGIEDLISDIRSTESGAHIGAFFDFDRTLIAGYSVNAFLQEQIQSGSMSPNEFTTQIKAAAKYSFGERNFSDLVSKTAHSMKGRSERSFAELGERVHKKKLAGSVYPEARRILETHAEMGHTIVIVSSATIYQIAPTARELGIEYILCTQLEVEDGILTGGVHSPTCFGEGKYTAARDFSDEMNVKMDKSFFYTDSEDDLPLLEKVGHPRPVNPSRELASVAREQGWVTCKFEGRNRPSVSQVLRTASIYAALPASMIATAPYQVLSGNKRSSLNAGMSVWADFASAFAGLTYEVDGEEHLWAKRPAVFIFNHQSSVDAVIMAKLLRQDFTAIGKQEIKSFPIIGNVLAYADIVFIDRASTEKAVEAMKPVVDAMKDEGLSVCLAPEGTRSTGRKLGEFKKGAFHIAMQAGVPIVPVVIHNASDSLPKSHNIVRSANIRVTVLKPISTARWNNANLDSNIKKVRKKFLDTLGQE